MDAKYVDVLQARFGNADGFLEIRMIGPGKMPTKQIFFDNLDGLAEWNPPQDRNIFLGCGTRIRRSGKKSDILCLPFFWADIDVNKGNNTFSNTEEALIALKTGLPEHLQPSEITLSGYGSHEYWYLKTPFYLETPENIEQAENIMKALAKLVKGDAVHNIDRLMRVPGTNNMKDPANPKPCETIFFEPDRRFELSDFVCVLPEIKSAPKATKSNVAFTLDKVSGAIKNLIFTGSAEGYKSRSERDHAILYGLAKAGADYNDVQQIFESHPCGDKYRSHNASETYLAKSYEKAKAFIEQCAAQNSRPASRENDKLKKMAKAVAELKEIYRLLFVPEQGFYFYLPNGVWRAYNDYYIRQMIERHCAGTKHFRSEIYEALAIDKDILIPRDKKLNECRNLLNLKSGMFDIDSFEIKPHDPKYLSSIQLNIEYNADAKCARWLRFIEEVLSDEEDRKTLQELFGYTLTVETKFEKAFFFVGHGANGKSVAIETLVALVGDENVSRVQPSELGKPFCAINLKDKPLNVSTDLEANKLVATGLLKAIISGEEIQDSYKFKNQIKFPPFCKMVFGANNYPRTTDKSFGFYRRIIFLNFDKTMPEDQYDRSLKEQLRAELPGIFNWALEGLTRLREQDHFSESEKSKEILEKYRKLNNNVAVFVEECVDTSDPQKMISKNELYAFYREWNQKNGYLNQSRESFFRDFWREVPKHVHEAKKTLLKGQRALFVVGAALHGQNSTPTARNIFAI